jgi:hypothetical protein
LLVLVALFVVGAGAAAAAPPSPDDPAGRTHEILGVVPSIPFAHGNAGRFSSKNNLSYHGGKVLRTNRTVAIYWLPNGWTMGPGYQGTITQYFQDVAAASGATSNVYGVETQYYDATGSISYSSAFGGAVPDQQPYPASGCTDNVSQTTNCLSDAQIRAELQRLYTAGSLGAANANTTYFVFTAKNVGSCYSGGSCAFSTYCAYHGNLSLGGTTVQYANQPYADTVAAACDAGYRPNGNDADATINVASHEHRESINDPLGTAWYDRQGYEGSDKCAWDFGTVTGGYNQTINGHHYILQQEWSNTSSGCALHS